MDQGQSAKGATIIGVWYGVKVVAEAGLLDNKRGTTHWYALEELRKKHPSVQYVPNRRIVADQGVVTTTGITASMPMSLTLIEAIAGHDKAEAVARDLGLDQSTKYRSPWSRMPGREPIARAPSRSQGLPGPWPPAAASASFRTSGAQIYRRTTSSRPT